MFTGFNLKKYISHKWIILALLKRIYLFIDVKDKLLLTVLLF